MVKRRAVRRSLVSSVITPSGSPGKLAHLNIALERAQSNLACASGEGWFVLRAKDGATRVHDPVWVGSAAGFLYTPYSTMPEAFHRTFFLNGPAGRLEAMLWTVSRKPAPRAALVCHPHPLFGGTMHNKVVFQVAKTLHQEGIPVLRFNFRGAGLSEGQHDKGVGEREDVQAALDYLSSAFPDTPILLAGFSFGSWVGLRVGCADARVEALVGLGLPVNHSELSYLVDCHKPKLFLQGGRDQYGARERVEALFEQVPPPKELVFVEDADHFFTGKLDRMAQALDRWLQGQFRAP